MFKDVLYALFHIKRKPIFKIKVIYKSGAVHVFETYRFTLRGDTIEWVSVGDHNAPIRIGGPEIAAVWQVGVRHVWRKEV
jgi:hypothetical protein